MKFGIILLEDTNGARMQSITHECRTILNRSTLKSFKNGSLVEADFPSPGTHWLKCYMMSTLVPSPMTLQP